MIYLVPGMGATSRMYEGPWHSLHNATALDWPDYGGEKSLDEVAERLIDEHAIHSDDVIVGSSLGGIIALQVHCRLPLRHVFLLGSATRREEVNRLLIALAPLIHLTPIRLLQHLAGKGASVTSAMLAEVDADFIRAMCLAVSKWEGYHGDTEAITRIHGARDRIIKCPADAHVIPGGGHLIAMTHGEECVGVVRGVIS